MNKLISLLLLPLFFSGMASAQNCLEDIYKAGKLLDAGNTDECISIAEICSRQTEDASIRWQAYRLLAIAEILKGSPDNARVAAENMLEINPTYHPNLLKDPREFINLLDKIVVIPRFSVGLALSAGSNTSFIRVSKGYVVSDYQKTYKNSSGFQFGTNLGFYINPKWNMELGINANTKKYQVDYSFSDWKVNVNEKLTYLDVPLTIKYTMSPRKRLRYFAQAGIFGGYLLYAQNDFSSENSFFGESYHLDRLNIKERRNPFNYGLTGGLGLYYKVPQGHVSIQANYFHSLKQINDPDKRYNYSEQIYTYYFVDDDVTLDNLAISLGYTFYLNYQVYRKHNPTGL